MILVTGAAGKTGRAVVQALVQSGFDVRVLVYRSESREDMRQLGAKDIVHRDMRDPVTRPVALANVRAVYHICPNVDPDELAIGRLAISAAGNTRIEHFVYHSVLHPQTEGMPHHWQKMRVEEQLFRSGLPFTILQPAPYMQNVLAGWDAIAADGIFHVPYPAETRLAMVDLNDVAQVAATVLSQPCHVGATYELVGTRPLAQTEVAAELSEKIGRPVRVERIELADWEREARDHGVGEYQLGSLLQMFRYYASHGLSGNPNVLEWLLGRPPTSFAAFLKNITYHQ
jgi:NAD(P)H dehydrogenase (quinone)